MAPPFLIFNIMYLFWYYNWFSMVQRKIKCHLFLNTIESIIIYFGMNNQCLMLMAWNILSIFRWNFDWTEELSCKIKLIDTVFILSKRKQGNTIIYMSKKWRCTTVISHTNNNESNNLNTSNSDNVIGTSNFPHSNI